MTEIFSQEAFYSSLHQGSLLTDEQYEIYIIDAKRCANQSSNKSAINYMRTRTLIIMHIMMLQLLKQHSSQYLNGSLINATHNSNKMKHSMRNIRWLSKTRCYRQPYSNCCLCGEAFIETSPPKLDRINNSICHTQYNCKPACTSGNTLHKQNNDLITKLHIRLVMYSEGNNLPTTVATISEHQLCRRLNISGVTHINLNIYNIESKKVINYKTPNIITHMFGFNFNSIYPLLFSSIST